MDFRGFPRDFQGFPRDFQRFPNIPKVFWGFLRISKGIVLFCTVQNSAVLCCTKQGSGTLGKVPCAGCSVQDAAFWKRPTKLLVAISCYQHHAVQYEWTMQQSKFVYRRFRVKRNIARIKKEAQGLELGLGLGLGWFGLGFAPPLQYVSKRRFRVQGTDGFSQINSFR